VAAYTVIRGVTEIVLASRIHQIQHTAAA